MSAQVAYPLAENGALYDPAQAEEYVAMLFRNVGWKQGQVISLLGIGEKGTEREGVFRERQIVPPGFIGMMHNHLKRWAEWHAAGFIVPAVLHPAAQEKGDVTLDKVAALTAIILDLDSGDVSAAHEYVAARLGRPSMVVASGGKTEANKFKAHVYWLFDHPVEDVERVAALRKMLAAKVGGDQSFGRATQVIRIPGSVHAKNGVPSVCRILDRSGEQYSFAVLAEAIEAMEPMPGVEAAGNMLSMPQLTLAGGMDFTPRFDTAVAALHRDIDAGGEDLTRWGEFSKVAGFHISEVRAGRITIEAAYTATNGWMLAHMNPPWPQQRMDQEFRALVNKDVEHHGAFPQSVVAMAEAARIEAKAGFEPSPATWPNPQMIPPRPWLFGRWAQRGIVTAMVAPGGVGKSSLIAAMMLSMSSDRPLLGKDIYGGPLRTWYLNLEDNGHSLARSRVAASIFHGVSEQDCGGRMYVDSGPDGMMICTAVEDRTGFQIIEPVYENIMEAIRRLQIDVLVIDPFVSSHAINENDNNRVDAVVKWWARVAQQANCAIILVHHTAKLHGERVTADSMRGAGALNNAARVTLVLNRMTPDQGEGWGIDPIACQRYFNVADDKHNLSPAEKADWFHLESVSLNNGTDVHPADSVGVVTPWRPPSTMDGIHAADLFAIQKVLHAGTYWKNSTVKENWAGEVVSNVLDIPLDPKTTRRITSMLDIWLGSGALKIEIRRNNQRKKQECIVVGTWAGDPDAYENYLKEEGNNDS